jgi:hypothetical protein
MTYTVDVLVQSWREEQGNKAVQPLPGKIAADIKGLVTTIEKVMSTAGEGSLQAAVARKEIENIKYLWNDLLKIRKEKIDRSVQAGIPVNEQCLLDFETEYYKAASGIVFRYEAGKGIFPEARGMRELSSNYMTIRLVQDAAEFVGLDLRTYGPFKKEDIAYMPTEHASILEKEGKAKKVAIPARV